MFYARNFALLDQVNYGAYQFQFDDFVTKVFGKMDAHFVKKVGFTVSDAMNFGQKIGEGTPEEVSANPHVVEAYLGEDHVTLPSRDGGDDDEPKEG